jgi:hypothetical protein
MIVDYEVKSTPIGCSSDTVFNCRKQIIRWNNVRWDTQKALKLLGEHKGYKVFMIPKNAVLKHFDIDTLDKIKLRGYLGLTEYYTLQLILLTEDQDIALSLTPPERVIGDALIPFTLLTVPLLCISKHKADKILDNMCNTLASRIRRWHSQYRTYVKLVNARHKKEDDEGLVRLFNIPGKDIKGELDGSCTYIVTFMALEKSDESIRTELIFQGLEISADFVSGLIPLEPAADDFTTPSPPFGSPDGYGLL